MNKLYIISPFVLFFIISSLTYSQEVNIVPYLKQIESGEKGKVLEKLKDLKEEYPDDPSVIFLQAVLTENGQNAVGLYKKIISKYPQSRYADASVYRLFAYYYALGLYETSKTFFEELKKDYPRSPYIKIAEKKIPAKHEVASEEKVEKEPPPPPTKTEVSKSTDYKFTVQAGAFSNSSNANDLKKKFDDAGFYSEINEKVVGGTTFLVVSVGKFLTESEASNFLDIVNTRFHLDGRVVPLQ